MQPVELIQRPGRSRPCARQQRLSQYFFHHLFRDANGTKSFVGAYQVALPCDECWKEPHRRNGQDDDRDQTLDKRGRFAMVRTEKVCQRLTSRHPHAPYLEHRIQPYLNPLVLTMRQMADIAFMNTLRTLTLHRSVRTAFALIELLAVLLVLAALAVIVWPTGLHDDSIQARRAAHHLRSDLEYARQRSLGTAENPSRVIFDVDSNRYEVVSVLHPTTPVLCPGLREPMEMAFGVEGPDCFERVSLIEVSTPNGDSITYTASGRLDQITDAVIRLRCGAAVATLTVDAVTGDIHIGVANAP